MKGIEKQLLDQLDKLFRHCRQGSIKTRYRYLEAMKRFIAFVAQEFRLEKLANIREKHLVAYLQHLINRGNKWTTIKTDLSGIRFWVDQVSPRPLPDNDTLAKKVGLGNHLPRVPSVPVLPRCWTLAELVEMQARAIRAGEHRYANMMQLAWDLGLRVHEAVRLDRATVEAALQSGILSVKGKNGLVRVVPLEGQASLVLARLVAETPRGHKLFVRPGEKAHQVLRALGSFIRNHRPATPARADKLVYHGLRHAYAERKYKEFRTQGANEKAARLRVARLLGHGRDSVTRVYLAGLDHEDDGDSNG